MQATLNIRWKKEPMSPWQYYGGIKASFRDPTSLSIPLHYKSQFGNSNPLLTTESFQPMCIKRGLEELSLQRIPVQNNAMQPRCSYLSHFNPKQKAPSEGYSIYKRADQSWKQSLWTTAGAAEAPWALLHKPSEHIVDEQFLSWHRQCFRGPVCLRHSHQGHHERLRNENGCRGLFFARCKAFGT